MTGQGQGHGDERVEQALGQGGPAARGHKTQHPGAGKADGGDGQGRKQVGRRERSLGDPERVPCVNQGHGAAKKNQGRAIAQPGQNRMGNGKGCFHEIPARGLTVGGVGWTGRKFIAEHLVIRFFERQGLDWSGPPDVQAGVAGENFAHFGTESGCYASRTCHGKDVGARFAEITHSDQGGCSWIPPR